MGGDYDSSSSSSQSSSASSSVNHQCPLPIDEEVLANMGGWCYTTQTTERCQPHKADDGCMKTETVTTYFLLEKVNVESESVITPCDCSEEGSSSYEEIYSDEEYSGADTGIEGEDSSVSTSESESWTSSISEGGTVYLQSKG